MKELDMLKDILQFRISSQIFYNQNLIHIRNPEVRQLFSELRNDEMRAVEKLQQKIQKLENTPYIVSKIFPIKGKQ